MGQKVPREMQVAQDTASQVNQVFQVPKANRDYQVSLESLELQEQQVPPASTV